MNKKFLSGFAVGILCSLVICLSVFALTKPIWSGGSGADYGSAGQQENDAEKSEGNSSLFSRAFTRRADNIKSVIDAYYYEDVDDGQLQEWMLRGMVAGLGDPYSCYYSEDEFNNVMESISGVYFGIGASVMQEVSTGIMTIVVPFEGCPASEAGMMPGDIIYKVDGEDVTGRDLTEVVALMKGEEGTEVVVTVYREGSDDPVDLRITRAEIEAPTVSHKLLEDNIGYIQILEFEETTSRQFSLALADLEKQGIQGLIVDVRDNPGGLYTSVINVLDRLIGKDKLLVYTVDKNGKRVEEYSKTKEEFKKPLVVMINGRSASASEIFAGAIRDYEMGTLVGEKSFGKGIVQTVLPLPADKAAVKLTTSHYYTPSGVCLHGTGVEPDVAVQLDKGLEKKIISQREKDNQLDRAVEVLKEKFKQK